MARPKKMTRAEIISMLKSRGQKGALSKMTKPQLRALLEKTAPPTESFTRAYQMRMPGSKAEKVKEKDPLASLMKAMQIDVTKTREKVKTDGRKPTATKESDDGKFHGTRARYPRSRADREPAEIESWDAT